MALARRSGQRFSASIWPGFVDAMTALLLVLMFVLSIFMIVQFMLRETITGQESELNQLSQELASLATTLGLERARVEALQGDVATRDAALTAADEDAARQAALISSLRGQIASGEDALRTAQQQISGFEAQVAALIVERNSAQARGDDLSQSLAAAEAARSAVEAEKTSLEQALASARTEIDAQSETARLAAARREALEALVAELKTDLSNEAARAAGLENDLSAEEKARLAETAAAQALRERLKGAETELTAMTLALEQQRRKAEETLTLLAGAQAAEKDLNARLAAALATASELENRVEAGASAAREAARLSQELATAQAELDALGAARSEAVVARDTLAARAEVAERDLEALRAQVADDEREIATLRAEVEALRADVGDAAAVREKLAAALAEKLAAQQRAEVALSEADRRDALLAAANSELKNKEVASAESQRKLALLNEQVSALRAQLGSLQSLIDLASERDAEAKIQIDALGSQLNVALARAAAEERRRAELEAAERKRLEEAQKNLEQYRSEFFGRLRDVVGNTEGVRVEGDRFVFSSEVLFDPGQARLSEEGRHEIEKVTEILARLASEIPPEIDWIIRVDGHTDDRPLSGLGQFADNWELSQGRALSVVRFMSEQLGVPPNRLSANGFGEYQPLDPADTPEARARNRRIELKLTER